MDKHTEWSQESSSSQDSCSHYFENDPDNGTRICKKCGKFITITKFSNEVQFDQGTSKLLGRNLRVGQNSLEVRTNKNYKEMDLIGQRLKIPQPVVEEGKNLYQNIRENSKIRPTFLKSVALYIGCRKDVMNNNKMIFDFSEDSNVEKRNISRTFFRVMKNDVEKNRDDTRQCNYPPPDAGVMLNRFFEECFPQDKSMSERFQIIEDAQRIYMRMKENSLDVGRIPAGIYGTSILLASTLNKKDLSIETVAERTRLSQSTIRKRLSELDNTPDVERSIEEYICTPVEMWQTNNLHPCMKGKITDYFIREDPLPFDKTCYFTQISALLTDLHSNTCSVSEEEIDLTEEHECDVKTYILNAEEVAFKTKWWEREFESGCLQGRIRRARIPFNAKEYRNITHYLSLNSSQQSGEQGTAIETSRRKRRKPRKKLPRIPHPNNSQITDFFSQTSIQSSQNSESSDLTPEITISTQPDPILPPLYEEINKDKEIPPLHPYLTPDRSYTPMYSPSPLPMDEYPTLTPPDSDCEDSLDIQLYDFGDNIFTPSSSCGSVENRS